MNRSPMTVSFMGKDFPVVYLTAGDSFPELREVPIYGFDIETYGIYDHPKAGLVPNMTAIRLMQIFDGETCYVIDWRAVQFSSNDMVPSLCKFFQEKKVVAHNAMFEIMHIKHNFDIDLKADCTMLMEQLYLGTKVPFKDEEDNEDEIPENGDGLGGTRFHGVSLAASCGRHFGVELEKEEQRSDWSAPILTDEQLQYAALDAVATFFLMRDGARLLKKYKQIDVYKLQKDTQHPIAMMQLAGFPIDWEAHERALMGWNLELQRCKQTCAEHFGEVNIQSGKQLSEWLVRTDSNLAYSWPRTAKGALSFSANTLQDYLDNPAIHALHSTKKLSKLVNAFGKGLVGHRNPVSGRIHSSYNIGKAGTGRMTSSAPNTQQFPRDDDFRTLFTAPDGYTMVVSDFSQIELRLQAEFSQDPFLLDVYRNGKDVYVAMAAQLFQIDEKDVTKQQRHFGKTMMLALGYGMGPNKLRTYAKYSAKPSIDLSIDQARSYHAEYHKIMEVYSSWCARVRHDCEENGYCVRTLMCKLRKLDSHFVYTQAPNTIIQGSAAELMMVALRILYHSIIGTDHVIIGVVHDEIVALAKKGEEKALQVLTENAMNEAMAMCFPNAVTHHVADAHSGINWAKAK